MIPRRGPLNTEVINIGEPMDPGPQPGATGNTEVINIGEPMDPTILSSEITSCCSAPIEQYVPSLAFYSADASLNDIDCSSSGAAESFSFKKKTALPAASDRLACLAVRLRVNSRLRCARDFEFVATGSTPAQRFAMSPQRSRPSLPNLLAAASSASFSGLGCPN